MAVLATIAFAAFLLENDHLVALHERNEDFAVHFCTFNGRHTDFHVAVGIKKKHLVEAHCIAFFHFFAEIVDIQELAFFGLELLSFDFYNSVHC